MVSKYYTEEAEAYDTYLDIFIWRPLCVQSVNEIYMTKTCVCPASRRWRICRRWRPRRRWLGWTVDNSALAVDKNTKFLLSGQWLILSNSTAAFYSIDDIFAKNTEELTCEFLSKSWIYYYSTVARLFPLLLLSPEIWSRKIPPTGRTELKKWQDVGVAVC